MKKARTVRRNAVALGLSTIFHIVILALILDQAAPDYETPETPAPPMDVRIEPMETPPPVIIPPPPAPPRTEPPKAVQPPKPTAPSPQPAPAATPRPAQPTPTPTPAPVAPKPAPVQAEAPRPVPLATPRPETRPTPAPPAPQAKAAAPAPPAPIRLNIHKPEKEAPGAVATLPMAPAPSPAAPSGGPRAPPPGGEPELGGSRLSGLTPYPYGSMPSGGHGLRGTLIGCANAEAVNLSAAERAKCNERFGTEAASAPALDPIAPAKRAAFDKAAAQQEADRKYRAAVPPGTTRGLHGFGGVDADQPVSLKDQITGGPK